jgi:hypothetical protein
VQGIAVEHIIRAAGMTAVRGSSDGSLTCATAAVATCGRPLPGSVLPGEGTAGFFVDADNAKTAWGYRDGKAWVGGDTAAEAELRRR